jgi:hypothetical protein
MPRGGAALPYNDFIYDNKSKTIDKWNIGTQRRIGSLWTSPALLKRSLVPLWVAELLEYLMQREAKLEWIRWVAESTHNTSVESFVVLVANGAL